MKPLSTLKRPLQTVDVHTKEAVTAFKERTDVCSVPAAGVVGEAMMALVLADAVLEKFGGDSLGDIQAAVSAYRARIGGR
jgi:chorismate synthase